MEFYDQQTLYYLPENDCLQIKGILNNSRRRSSSTKDILLCWKIVGLSDAINVVKVTESRKNSSESGANTDLMITSVRYPRNLTAEARTPSIL